MPADPPVPGRAGGDPAPADLAGGDPAPADLAGGDPAPADLAGGDPEIGSPSGAVDAGPVETRTGDQAERPAWRQWLDAPAPMKLALAASLAGILVAFAIKQPCVTHPWSNYFQYRHLCYNDIQPLFYLRGVSHGQVPYKDVFVEYPVLIGSFMYAAGRFLAFLIAHGLPVSYADPAYFVVTAVLLSPFSLAVTLLLRPRVTTGRLLLWAVGTPTLLYSFLNWDLLAVAALTWGMVEVERRRWGWAGIALGLGASAKLYPAFAIPCVALAVLANRDLRALARLAAGFVGSVAAANVPWMIVAFRRWMQIWTWQASRYPDYGTAWYWLGKMADRLRPDNFWNDAHGYGNALGIGGLITFALVTVVTLWVGWRRRSSPEGYPVAGATLALIASFMVISKVNSPQYALWVLPLLVLVQIPWRAIVAYLVSDLVLFVSGFYWFTEFSSTGTPGWERLFELAVFARAICLAWFAISAATRGDRRYPEGYPAPDASRVDASRAPRPEALRPEPVTP